jgi:multiple antibiotic resistance protein
MDFSGFINHFVALLVIANPLSALPAVLRITRSQSLSEKRRTGLTSAAAVGLILLTMTWFGTMILNVLGIKLPAFQVAGGFVLLMMAVSMLNAEESAIKGTLEEQKTSSSNAGAIVPLAIPIIAGPGAISSVIVSVNEHSGILNQLIISASCILVALVMGALLYFASNLERLFGSSGINIITRIGGLILAAIAIQILASGLGAIFPGLIRT